MDSFPFNKEVIRSIMGWDKKPRVGRTPEILRKGHSHVVERDPDYTFEIEDGLIEYEVHRMAKRLPVGGHVEVLLPFASPDEWQPGEVIDLLDAQFTAEVDGATHFFLYVDRDVTWRQLREGD